MHRKCQNNKKTNKGQWKMNGKTSKTQITERIKNIKTNIKNKRRKDEEKNQIKQKINKKLNANAHESINQMSRN